MSSYRHQRISRFEEFSKNHSTEDKIQELTFCLKEVIGRFAKICENEKFEHGLPVIPPPDAPRAVEALPKMKKSTYKLPEIRVPEVKKEPESNNIVYDYGDQIPRDEPIPDTGKLMPVDFVWEYCQRDRTTPMYEDMGTVGRSPFSQEHVVICRVRNIAGEGKSRRKATAKQCAAAMLIKILLNRQMTDRLPEGARPISPEERLLAIRVMSEVLDFEKELEEVSQDEHYRAPIYTPMVNSSGFHVRCKALGYSSVGYGRTKEVGRRMAAKLILDMNKEAKDLAKKKIRMQYEMSRSVSSVV